MKPAIADADILSTFGKVGRIDLLQRLFQNLYVAPAVYRELMRVEQMGLSWVLPVKEAIEPLPLTQKQMQAVEEMIAAYPQLGCGELETFVLAKTHRLLCLTNDRRAKRVSHALGLPYLDLEEILRAIKLKGLMTTEALSVFIELIEERDHTRIKAKKHVLED